MLALIGMNKAWPAIGCALVGLVAFSEAWGITHWVGAELATALAAVAPTLARLPEAVPAADATPVEPGSLEPVTEPLGGAPDVTAIASSIPPTRAATPSCDFGHVTLIVATDPEHSFASVTTETTAGRFYKVGDAVGQNRIGAIAWDRVWFSGQGGRCQMRLGVKARPAPVAKPERRPRDRRGKLLPPPLPDQIASKIVKLGPGHYAIQRSAFNEVFEMRSGLVRGTRVRQVKEGGEVVGLSLNGRGVGEGSLLHTIGLRAGDVVKGINGFDVSDPQKALEAYGRLRSANRLTLRVERNGSSHKLEYQIQ
jgi:general secretion pathway protein C